MSLPTRVNRAMVVDPFEATGRDFDNVLTRLFGGRDLQATAADGRRMASMFVKTPIIFTSKLNCPATKKRRSTSPWKTRR